MTLKQCPFCQSNNVSVLDDGFSRYSVECSDCMCSGPPSDTEEEAIRRWNGEIYSQNEIPILLVRGNMLDSGAQALVNPVNCVGVMGAGLALQFKRKFPANFIAYRHACKDGLVRPGKVFIFQDKEKYIINFPTKRHWRDKSKLEDIDAGLVDMVAQVKRLGIKSVAIPKLGCGLGGLEWVDVLPLILQHVTNISGESHVYIFYDL